MSTTAYQTNAIKETDEQIEARLEERFSILEKLTDACIKGNARSLVISGPAGLGKSYSVEKKLEEWDANCVHHTIVKGYVRTTGLVKTLYRLRHPGCVIVFDDADSIFFDDNSLTILKAVCDTTEKRRVHYLAEGSLIDEESAERIPKIFDFDGTVIFITNYDFDSMIQRNHKLSAHFQALVSRSHYIDLSMKSRRDYLVRIRQMICKGLLSYLSPEEQVDVYDFIESNHHRLRELSLRMAIKLANIRKDNGIDWKQIANVTCCKN